MLPTVRSLLRHTLPCVLFFPLLSPINANAAFVCYNEKHFPSVFKLAETDNGIEAHLGGAYADLGNNMAPTLTWRKDNGWHFLENRECYPCEFNSHDGKCPIAMPKWPSSPPDKPCGKGEDCREGIPVITLGTQAQPEEIIEEKASSCVEADNDVWFGIDFYRGEGYTGYGGLGRYGRQSNTVDIRRVPELRDHPIHKVVWDGNNLWAATTTNYECLGHPPALGLVKYSWETEALTTYKGKNTGPCGFIIHDLLWSQGFLWVATDVGISRWDAKKDSWTHYLPDRKPPYTVKEGRCDAFYRQLLDLLPKDETWFDETESYHEIFYNYLKAFRPDFIKRYESR